MNDWMRHRSCDYPMHNINWLTRSSSDVMRREISKISRKNRIQNCTPFIWSREKNGCIFEWQRRCLLRFKTQVVRFSWCSDSVNSVSVHLYWRWSSVHPEDWLADRSDRKVLRCFLSTYRFYSISPELNVCLLFYSLLWLDIDHSIPSPQRHLSIIVQKKNAADEHPNDL